MAGLKSATSCSRALRRPMASRGCSTSNPGYQMARPNGTLNQVTGSSGSQIFRGDRLPKDMVGDYFYGEPVARIVRRVRPVVTEGLTQLQNVYQNEQSEFIRSADNLFRPVEMETAPDGTMYIVDTYRGIVQEGNWTRPGSLPASAHRSIRHGEHCPSRTHLANHSIDGIRTRQDTAADARPETGRIGPVPGPPQRLVARHRAANPRSAARSLGRSARSSIWPAEPTINSAKSTRCGRWRD